MARPGPDLSRCSRIYHAVTQHPGLTAPELNRLLGFKGNTVHSALPTMERAGFLLTEDAHGRLYPFALRGAALRFVLSKPRLRNPTPGTDTASDVTTNDPNERKKTPCALCTLAPLR